MPSQYEPRTTPVFENQDLRNLTSYIYRELREISQTFTGIQAIQLQETHVPPPKLVKGMLVLADGTNWNPGSGRGFYAYDGTTWRYLG